MPTPARPRGRPGIASLMLALATLPAALGVSQPAGAAVPPGQSPPGAGAVRTGQTPPGTAAAPWTVTGEAGLVFVGVKAAQTVAFEAGIAALKDVLIATADTIRQRQRDGWRVYRQVEPWRGGVLYLFVVTPVVPGADYSVSTILAEGLPDDVTVRPAYVAALMGQQSLLDCSLMVDLGEGLPPPEMVLVDDVAPAVQTPDAVTARDARTFSGDLGLVLMTITAERLADFELTMARLKSALAASPDPVLQKQARSWRVLKPAALTDSETVTVAFLMDPPVPGANYAVSRILSDAFPAETGELFKNYRSVFATEGVTLLNYTLVSDFRQ